MADQPEKNPSRTAADKERSRQQSRPVSGKNAQNDAPARGTKAPASKQTGTRPGGKPGTGKPAGKASTNGAKPGARPRNAQGGGGRGGQGGGGRGGGGGGGRGGPPPRSAAPFIWAGVAVVLVVVLVVVVVAISGGKSKPSVSSVSAAPASVVRQATTIPTSVYDAVGINSPSTPVTPPTAVTGKNPLTFDGKPGVFYFGAEYCPYCAAERWAIVTSMARFGTFSDLKITQSSSTDVDANTHTFSFRSASLTSDHLTFKTVEHQNGSGAILQQPTSTEAKLVNSLDSGQTYPFVDFGNKFAVTSASYNPAILQGLTWQQIASGLHDPTNPVTQTILATSNYFSAATCATTGGQPSSVCQSKGVQAAAKAMGAKF